MCQIVQINNRVIAIDSSQNFVISQYLKNNLMEFDKTQSIGPDLNQNCLALLWYS